MSWYPQTHEYVWVGWLMSIVSPVLGAQGQAYEPVADVRDEGVDINMEVSAFHTWSPESREGGGGFLRRENLLQQDWIHRVPPRHL